MKQLILCLFFSLAFAFGADAQKYNIIKDGCDVIFVNTTSGDTSARLELLQLDFDSSNTNHIWFRGDDRSSRFSLNHFEIDSIVYGGTLDTISAVATALSATNIGAVHTIIGNWKNACSFGLNDNTGAALTEGSVLTLQTNGAGGLSWEVAPFRILYGSGSPEGAVIGNLGDIYINTAGGAGTTLYMKEADDGLNTGWAGM